MKVVKTETDKYGVKRYYVGDKPDMAEPTETLIALHAFEKSVELKTDEDILASMSTKEIKAFVRKANRELRSRSGKVERLSNEERSAILDRDGHKCVVCGRRKDLQVHHIIYRSKGGTNNADNLITLCGECHTRKHKGEQVENIMKAHMEYLKGAT